MEILMKLGMSIIILVLATTFLLFNILPLIITTWRQWELLRWEQHYFHTNIEFEFCMIIIEIYKTFAKSFFLNLYTTFVREMCIILQSYGDK
jgi:hypothetical protein